MRVIVMVFLLAAAASASADWVKMGKTEKKGLVFMSDDTVYYIDPSTITRDGNIRKVWEIHDLNDKGPRGERSILAAVEYDCASKMVRTVSATGKSLHMGRGEIIPMGTRREEWSLLTPSKETEVFFKILNTVCAP